MKNQTILRIEIKSETDIVWSRKKAREIAEFLLLDTQEQTRVSTAVSEITRNAYQYAHGGIIEFSLIEQDKDILLSIAVKDKGRGIRNLREIQNGTYISPEGMGIGLMGAKKLMDDFNIETSEQGTTVLMRKKLPKRTTTLNAAEIQKFTEKLMTGHEASPAEELQKQNREILNALGEINDRREELARLNQELEDTNRGVVALYAELDEKAESLRKANEAKTSFLSNMTHEFRSPLNSILSIAGIIKTEAQNEGAPERVKQINFIIKAAEDLSVLVNDLLDIAKIESGKVEVKASTFDVSELFSTLRGLMKPLVNNEKLTLNFEETVGLKINTDEGKLSQILRNLISNALKFTEAGEVSVSVSAGQDNLIYFNVKDTGVGIPANQQESIFEEFIQVENPLQFKSKGTGLGLPLSRKLARLLGGDIVVTSAPGEGSTFTLTIENKAPKPIAPATSQKKNSEKKTVLIIDDDNAIRYSISRALNDLPVNVKEARSVDEGINMARFVHPDVIVLDLVMPDKNGIDFLNECLNEKDLRNIPVILHTSKFLQDEERSFLEQSTKMILMKEPGHTRLKEGLNEILKSDD